MNIATEKSPFDIRPLTAGDKDAFIPLKIDNSGYSYDRIEEFSETMWETLLKAGNQMMVYLTDGPLAGIASIEQLGEGVQLSFYLKPEYRGKGLGTALIRELIRMASEQYPDEKIYIRIRKGNIPSIRAAEKAGAVFEQYENGATYEVFLSGLQNIENEVKEKGEEVPGIVIDEMKQGVELARDAVLLYTVPAGGIA